ncbi:hypothetical protein [Nocardia grenadensis]|uniref:hypothetical protein n=1 Tax=Nocardia grenadensis TaxID=931537 RepID=UPI0007A4D9B9|nr:hypothetical protein [Nocardia grenadensis]
MVVPGTRPESDSRSAADAAFGARTGRTAAELPEPADPLEMWWRAVALGGAGHYAAAHTALRRLSAATVDPVLLSLAASTQGSLLRQLGWHRRAAEYDGRAAALVLPALATLPAASPRTVSAAVRGSGPDPRTAPPGGAAAALGDYGRRPDSIDAVADALIGLAADALGVGRTALSTRLLDRCVALLERPAPECGARAAGAPARARGRVRLHWVRAEIALADGLGAPALAAAEAALALAEQGPSVRHRIKSRLLVAAAASATGQTARAVALADRIDEECRVSGSVPLRWACAMLRGGLAAEPGDRDTAVADAAACRALISRRGGRFRDGRG